MRSPAIRCLHPAGVTAALALDPSGHAPTSDGAAQSPDQIAQREGWHRSARSGTLRAVIFGVSDGLVSNLSLVMGVAGAATAGEAHFILLAGVAGPAGRRVQHGRGRVHLDAEPARAVRAPDRAGAGGARSDARRGAGRARGALSREGFRESRSRPRSPSGCSATRRRRSTRSSARSWASIPTSSGRHGAQRAARSRRSRPVRWCPWCRTS